MSTSNADAAQQMVREAVAALAAAGVPTELRVAIERRRFRGERMRVLGQVWRLGAVCVDADARLYATGEVLVVTEPTHPNFRSETALRRNELRRIAVKSGVPAHSTVVLDAAPLSVDAPLSPLVSLADGVGVEWARGAAGTPLGAYLWERAELLIHPPQSATD